MQVKRALPWAALAVAAVLGTGLTVALTSNPSLSISPAAQPAATDVGTLTCTTNGNGYCTGQPHSLGVVPTAVLVTPQAPISGNPIAGAIDADSFTAATFRIRVFQPNGSGFVNHVVTYSYAAYAGAVTPPPTTTTPAPTTTTPPPTTTEPPPTTTEPPPPTTTEPPPPTGAPAPGSVGLKVSTTRTWAGGRLTDAADFPAAGWSGSGTQADPYLLSRTLVTSQLTLGCGCGSNALTNVWVEIDDSWIQGEQGNPTPDTSRMLFVENDGPHVTVRRSNLRPGGTLNADGIRTDNHCTDNVILSYRPIVVEDSWMSGGAVLFRIETETNETGTILRHSELHGICSNAGDHTDVVNENGHGSNALYENNLLDGTRSGGAVVNNAFGLYDDNIGQCDSCATTVNHTLRGNRVVHYNIGVLSGTDTARIQGPWVVQDNVFDAPTALGQSGGAAYVARTPTAQSGNTVNGQAVTF